MSDELRLGLRDHTLVFPEGKLCCLVCGRPPAGVRRVYYETVEGEGALEGRMGAAGAGVQAIANRLTFDAPLCADHRRKATLTGLAGVGFMLLALAVIALGAAFAPKSSRKGGQADIIGYVFMGLALIPGGFGYVFWRRKDRGGLPCEVRREGAELVLVYPGRAPNSSANT